MDNLKVAKSLFAYQQLSPKAIAFNTGISEEAIRTEIYKQGGWLEQLNAGVLITEEEYELISPIVITQAKAKSLSLIQKGLDNINVDEEFGTKEIKDVTEILTALDKIDRLDKGKATSITGIDLDRYDAKDIVALRRSRSDYIETEYMEIEDGT